MSHFASELYQIWGPYFWPQNRTDDSIYGNVFTNNIAKLQL